MYYAEINETKCCGRAVCTECFAVTARPNAGKGAEYKCPFCNVDKYEVNANVPYRNLQVYDDGEGGRPDVVEWDDELPEDLNLWLAENPNADRAVAKELFLVGIPVEEIIESIRQR
jgi:hypothetical protein